MSRKSWKSWFSSADPISGQVPTNSRHLKVLGAQGLSAEEIAEVERAFDYQFYASYNDDVVRAGWDLLDHYLRFGTSENRWPTPYFNPDEYRLLNPDVARVGAEPFVHYVISGRHEGRATRVTPPAPSGIPQEPRDEPASPFGEERPERIQWHVLAGLDPKEAADQIHFADPASVPVVTVIVPVHNAIDVTLECLMSVSGSVGVPDIEVVVVDDASDDETRDALQKVQNIRLIRLDENAGFATACNIGAREARGEFLILLNSDVQVAPDCIHHLLAIAKSLGPECGILGPVLLSPDGSIQEIGSTVTSGGLSYMNGHGSAMPPKWGERATFQVDFVSGAAMLVRRDQVTSSGLFDEGYAGGYYEDVSLCLSLRRDKSLATRVVTSAYALHHLSRTMNLRGRDHKHLVSRANRITFVERHLEESFPVPVRNVAFYLPQFHQIPENDEWWGSGFTEWTNVSEARPVFSGHVQPRTPTALGYYSLDDIDVLDRQATLARKYGVDAFCFYYYSFSGHNPLGRPLEALLASPETDVTYCLCWANENWVRSWDGGDKQVLLGQIDSDENTIRAAEGILPHLLDPRYLRIEGRPLVLVYRPLLFADPLRTTQIIRNVFRRGGVAEVELAYVESMELADRPKVPEHMGFDLSIQFPPHGLGVKVSDLPEHASDLMPKIYDYNEMVKLATGRRGWPWLRVPGVTPRWDNTPRQRREATIFVGSTPQEFFEWLKQAHDQAMSTLPPAYRMVFINAWNEWGEGAFLEPEAEYGYQYLEAIARLRDQQLAAFNV